MIAGTLAVLDEPAEPLESWFRNRGLPALVVEDSQDALDADDTDSERPIQRGKAAARAEENRRVVDVGVNTDGEPIALDERYEPHPVDVATEWVADVTRSGIIAAESVHDDGPLPFPFDLFYSLTGQRPRQQWIDVRELKWAWDREDVLVDVWMAGEEDFESDGAAISYHDAAEADTETSLGLGFAREWGGRVYRGVVYPSGYLAIHSSVTPAAYVEFAEETVLPFAETKDGGLQELLGGA